jgi:tripartite-type tricarboxylate transporter receptor subunit TctC
VHARAVVLSDVQPFVAPYPAAGVFDAVARVLAEPMRKILGRPVVIDALLS